MKKAISAARSRRRLDERCAGFGPAERYRPPTRGWIRAIREALGMTTAQLAARMGVRQPTVVGLERSEERGTIEMATLRRAAEALDCTVAYVLIPNRPLGETVLARTHAFLRRRQQPVEHTMLLEQQQVTGRLTDADVEEALREMNPALIWDDPAR
jgi:predicted DNA-binding mobile mystery protein A